jgi:DNA-binding NarL/FixJ family response regulator
MPTRTLIIDDHQIMRDGLRLLLRGHPEFELVGNAYDTDSGWQAIEELKPDLVLMDLDVPGEGGLALTARVHASHPRMKVLVLTGHHEIRNVRAALEAGANGYILKANGFALLIHAMTEVVAGRTYLCPDVSALILQHLQKTIPGAAPAALSAREVQVLEQIANGNSTKEIAANMGISAKTVETHRTNLMNKLKVNSVAELTKYAVREGLTKL